MERKNEIVTRFFKVPQESFFLFGPRGTGKSFLLEHLGDSVRRLDLLDPEVFRVLSARPERLREMLRPDGHKQILAIDEIQKIPELLEVVHLLIEQRKDVQFILTGSSARKLRRAGVNLLGGRALTKTMHPFMAGELAERFDLENAMERGLLPVVWASTSPEETLRSYAATYLREEVQMEGIVRNIGAFSRVMETLSFSHAAVLNIAEVARETQVERNTVEGYIRILEDLLLAYRLPMFTKRARRALSSHPKFYYFDAGVYRALRPRGPLDRPEEIGGAALEGLVAQHLRAWAAYTPTEHQLFFWRTRGGVEVDLVIYGPDVFAALEVKHTSKVRAADLGGLRAFAEDYPEARRYFVYRGDEELHIDGVACIPAGKFLRSIVPGKWAI